MGATSAAIAAPEPAEPTPPATAAGSTTTLITGDRVISHGDTATVEPGPGRDRIGFATYRDQGHLYVVPSDATALVTGGRLDKRLFDVTALLESGYGDAERADLPLIASGLPTTLAGSTVTQALPSLDAAGISTPKARLGELWTSITGSRDSAKVWLDGKRTANLDRSAAQIGAPQAWQSGLTGEGTTVAVLDTGVDQTHPDLADREAGERNFTDSADAADHYGHGTHVASTVAGTGAFSQGKYRGIAHGSKLLDGKVLNDSGAGQESWIIAGMEWAAEQKADVVNLSLGGGDTPEVDPLEEAVNRLSASSGSLFVIAAGNSGPSPESVGSPGSADAALTVGAVDRQDGLAQFSSRGPRVGDGAIKPDITAPGVGIVAALHGDGTIGEPVDGRYTALSGTSMATPHVAGAAALLAQAHPDWTGAQLKAALTGSAKPNPALTAFEQGSGRVDVPAALAQTATSEPTSLGFGVQRWPHDDDQPVTKPLTIRNNGTAETTFAVSAQGKGPDGQPAPAGLFSVDKQQVTVPPGGTAQVNVTVDTRIGALDGAYSGEVLATSDNARVRTPVAVVREVESYDLTVEHVGPDGQPNANHFTLVNGLGGQASDDLPTDQPSSTVRLPKGRYAITSMIMHGDPKNPDNHLMSNPTFDLAGPAKLTFDARQTKPVVVTPPDPAAKPEVASIGYSLPTDRGTLGFTLIRQNLEGMFSGHVGPQMPGFLANISTQWTGAKGTYNLGWYNPGQLPNGFERHVAPEDLATVHAEFGAPVAGRGGYRVAYPVPAEGKSSGGVSAAMRIGLPSTRTEFYNDEGVRWTTGVDQLMADGRPEVTLQSAPKTYAAGQEYRERFNVGPFGPALPASPFSGGWAERTGDVITAAVPMFGDGAGNAGQSVFDTGRTTLHLGDQLIGESPRPGSGRFQVGPDNGRYRLTAEATRAAGFEVSTKVSSAWTFDSAGSPDTVPLPLSAVRFAPELDATSTAPAGTHQEVPVFLEPQGGAPTPPAKIAVQVSYDEGATWIEAPVIDNARVALDHPADATSVSLRASAEDAQGNTVEQTIIRAYKLGR
ncbi:S8 family serine peptidase [Saccharopolyspora taberi]|uniref:S8 family serine peptidase n=1 Tax=Saccharopolyspora taberi TaxID=60895 RepID=UPI0031DE3CC8